MRHEILYLDDILQAIDAIGRFIQGLDEEAFERNEMVQSAVLQKLTVIGEAAGRISQQLRDEYPQVEWRPIIGFRNFAVHEYFAVDLSVVWSTAVDDVPALRTQIEEILETLTNLDSDEGNE